MNYRPVLNNIPPVVKNLIIINILFFVATYILELNGIRLSSYLGLYFPLSENFRLHQIFTHMFMHGGLSHIFFNMFALYMFGRVLENVWGSKRFLVYFLITGIGAAILHSFVNFLEYQSLVSKMSPETIEYVKTEGPKLWNEGKNFSDNFAGKLNMLLNIPTVGASGAVFGLLLAFGMLFPNTQLMLLFPPIPIKAKYFVIGYGAVELYLGFSHSGGNIAHFAHLGGMLFGFILIKYWNKTTNRFY
jgi:membrane associated rhomboid family serine protease